MKFLKIRHGNRKDLFGKRRVDKRDREERWDNRGRSGEMAQMDKIAHHESKGGKKARHGCLCL